MGQQQLLLLVLSTVIVGLATVAGIQAFSENQAQASQDALVQRGTSIASDVQGLAGKPSQMGGIDLSDTDSDIASSKLISRLGYENLNDADSVAAQGAGSSAGCGINATGGSVLVHCRSPDAPQDVTVGFDPTADPKVQTEFGSGEKNPFD
ncbi:hypothetical protein [Salinibacter ruber]|uniref:hypothetical protein n=1 Tax=Salinibacter ruber TaxID=146919 RepID=UPI000E594C9D|nr:hypothetical protein [Salinibacter ruber]